MSDQNHSANIKELGQVVSEQPSPSSFQASNIQQIRVPASAVADGVSVPIAKDLHSSSAFNLQGNEEAD